MTGPQPNEESNDGTPQVNLPGISVGRVEPGATPFDAQNVNDTYIGFVRNAGGASIRCVIKSTTKRQLANEIIASTIGQCLGLPVPGHLLAVSPPGPDQLASKVSSRDGSMILFASALEEGKMARIWSYQNGGDAGVAQALYTAGSLAGAYSFDEHVANVDRHQGNLLVSSSGKVWLIDHGYCFTGPNWGVSDLVPVSKKHTSRLQGWCTPHLQSLQKSDVAAGVPHYRKQAEQLYYSPLLEELEDKGFISASERTALNDFLEQRLPFLPNLVATASDGLGVV